MVNMNNLKFKKVNSMFSWDIDLNHSSAFVSVNKIDGGIVKYVIKPRIGGCYCAFTYFYRSRLGLFFNVYIISRFKCVSAYKSFDRCISDCEEHFKKLLMENKNDKLKNVKTI
jgi:hypothetical protein